MPALCSIVISSYNKAQFVGQTVESALSQTYSDCEVIVVDDGSVDASVEVLQRFGERIKLVSQANGGQAAAMNTGYALSRGEIVLFLDCDDLLLPDTVGRVVSKWRPDLAKLHFRLQKINDQGTPLSTFLPPYRALPRGDLSETALRFGFYSAPPTSGNAFARRYLEQIMPLPAATYRIEPDTHLIGLAPFFGQIEALDGIGGYWRQGASNHSKGDISLARRETMICDEFIRLASPHVFGTGSTERLPAKWPQYLKRKVLLAKFDDDAKTPAPALWRSIADYAGSVVRWPEYDVVTRLKFVAWAAVMGLIPATLLRRVPGIAGPHLRLAGSAAR